MKATKNPQHEDMKGRAKASLEDSLGAVAQVLSALPNTVVRMPSNAADAFLLIDPVLSTIHRQLLDARANSAQMAAMFGAGDAMAEAIEFQIAALTRAYDERLAALRKKREESARALKGTRKDELMTEEKKPADVRRRVADDRRRNNGTLWLWAILILRESRASAKKYGLVPNAA